MGRNAETTVKVFKGGTVPETLTTDMLFASEALFVSLTSTDNGYALTVVVKSFLYLDL